MRRKATKRRKSKPEDWRTLLMVGLDAMYAGRHEDAEAIWDRLDEIEPGWQERVGVPETDESMPRQLENKRRKVVALVLWQWYQGPEIAHLFGTSDSNLRNLAGRGECIVHARIQGGRWRERVFIEDDFEPADVRREKRRIAILESVGPAATGARPRSRDQSQTLPDAEP